jgi:hypothetical protein
VNGREPTPTARLIAQRANTDHLYGCIRELDRPLEIRWEPSMGDHEPGDVTWQLGPELSRSPDLVKYAASYYSIHEGRFHVVLEIRPGELHPGDQPQGTCELGAILQSFELYEFGVDLVRLRESGFRMAWTSAQWLYAAARDELVALHHDGGKAHGALAPRHIRLGLFETPYANYDRPRTDDEPPPFKFLYGSRDSASDSQRAAELALLASTIASITAHPDPRIDRLLHDPSPGAHEVLRDLLLQRGEPVDLLLRDRTNTPGLALKPLDDDEAVDADLCAMWDRAVLLDPMMDGDTYATTEQPA